MQKKLKFLTFFVLIAIGFVFPQSVSALEYTDSEVDLVDAGEVSEINLCSSPHSQNVCAPTERIIASEVPAAPSDEIVSGSTDEPPVDTIVTTPATVSQHPESIIDESSETSLWPMYLSLGALGIAILLVMILNLCGRYQA